jgi:hypothetical protein
MNPSQPQGTHHSVPQGTSTPVSNVSIESLTQGQDLFVGENEWGEMNTTKLNDAVILDDAVVFDDFLIRDSLEEAHDQAGIDFGQGLISGSKSDSPPMSNSYDELPVFRSMEVMGNNVTIMDDLSGSGVDKVFEAFEAPVFPMCKGHVGVGNEVEVKRVEVEVKRVEVEVEKCPVDDLFAQLNEDFAHTSVPCQSDLLGGLASVTSVGIVASGLEELSALMSDFLSSCDVQYEHCAMSGLWKCEMTDYINTCRFHIQAYCDCDEVSVEGCVEYTVEFLRMSGCTFLFSKQFQNFKSSRQEHMENVVNEGFKMDICEVNELKPLSVEVSHAALQAVTAWAEVDRASAVGAVTGIYSAHTSTCALFSIDNTDKLSTEGILVMTLLGTLCMKFSANDQDHMVNGHASSSLPMLSLLHLLLKIRTRNDLHSTTHMVLNALVDSLVPATARLTANSNISACERYSAMHMMEINCL